MPSCMLAELSSRSNAAFQVLSALRAKSVICAIGMQGHSRPWQHAAEPKEGLPPPTQAHPAPPVQQRVSKYCQLACDLPHSCSRVRGFALDEQW